MQYAENQTSSLNFVHAFPLSLSLSIDQSIKNKPRPCSSNFPVLAVSWDLGYIGQGASYRNYLQILYDQVYSIKYFGTAMAPLWKHYYKDIAGLIQQTSYSDVIQVGHW